MRERIRPGDYEGPGRKGVKETPESYDMDIASYADKWFYLEEADCWCLEDVVYCEHPGAADLQSMNLFVPKAYLTGNGTVPAEGQCGAFCAADAPVVLQSAVMGYSEAPAASWIPHSDKPDQMMMAQMLREGMVFVSVGVRGRQTRDDQGRYIGKSPAYLVDVKAAIRFLRHNRAQLPGDMEKLFFVGVSAGGNLAALVGTSGNSARFDPYLREIGAVMEEKDDVLAVCPFCPITDLEHADMAYEWMFPRREEAETVSGHAPSKEASLSPAASDERSADVSGEKESPDAFRAACAQVLARRYVSYIDSLALRSPKDGGLLDLTGEREGHFADYLREKLEDSASGYLTRIGTDSAIAAGTVSDYLSGNYTQRRRGPGGPGEVPGTDKRGWLSWDGTRAHITSMWDMEDTYLCRFKDCPSFDGLEMEYFENEEFGGPGEERTHFNAGFLSVLEELKDAFPQMYARYYPGYRRAAADVQIQEQVRLLNPMYYIRESSEDTLCGHYRIRVGSMDPHTSFSCAAILALCLQEKGKDVDFEFTWEQSHGLCDDGGLVEWIRKISKSV